MKEDFATCFLQSLAVCAGLLVFVLTAVGLRQCANDEGEGTPWTDVVCDTVRDTVLVAQPAVRDSVVLGWVEVRAPRVWGPPSTSAAGLDSLTARDADSATVLLPMERKVYGDSTYRAVVSGIGVKLDSMTVYPSTVTRTLPAKVPRRWGVGVQAGVGMTPRGVLPYAGVGVYYRIF